MFQTRQSTNNNKKWKYLPWFESWMLNERIIPATWNVLTHLDLTSMQSLVIMELPVNVWKDLSIDLSVLISKIGNNHG
ncbi:unnamed protein product [Caenorhabditis angaria]|uniref:Uncharacterized protein n=1 Tax=Caenorhabditis angaria TaxID=860376 RepID=A0A9P1IDY0_9PELO|nr:unnamed protein product [Caenorhabditis angaria]